MKKLYLPLIAMMIAGCQPVVSDQEPPATPTLVSYIFSTESTQTPAAILPATQPPSGPTATPFTHIVQQGETLLGIAIRYGVTLDDLLLVNPGVDPRILSVGQNILIPGPGGEPIDLLLPTPTAMPLEVGQVRCYPDITESVRCLVKVTNTLDSAVASVALHVSLFDSNGQLLDQSPVTTMSRLLLPDQYSILDVAFPLKSQAPINARAVMSSAVQVLNLDDRYIPSQVKDLKVERYTGDSLLVLGGSIELGDIPSQGELNITIQAFGFSSEGEPNASNALQMTASGNESPVRFQLSLFSLRGGIEEFDILVEVQRTGPLE